MYSFLNRVTLFFCGICIVCHTLAYGTPVDGNRIMDQPMNENLCALTFDDGPSRYTPQLLDTLASYGISATFFVLGKNASYFPEIIRRIVESGHEVGNHSWSHPNLKHLTTEQQFEQIKNTDEVLRSLGATPLFMRPPYGAYDERTLQIVEDLGASLILWSMDSKDWKKLPENYATLLSTRGTVYEPGELRGIFLFHDIHKGTVDDLPKIIENLQEGGCQRFVTVTEYLAGILDPEPPLLMSRHKPPLPARPEVLEQPKAYAAGKGPVPLARCSAPLKAKSLPLQDAHAAVENASSVSF